MSVTDYSRPVLCKYYPDKHNNKKQISNQRRKNEDNCNNMAGYTNTVFQEVKTKQGQCSAHVLFITRRPEIEVTPELCFSIWAFIAQLFYLLCSPDSGVSERRNTSG